MKKELKANTQLQILANEFTKNPVWDSHKIRKIADMTGLSHYKVYKWAWDQKKKIKNHKIARNQFIKPSKRTRDNKLTGLFSKKPKKTDNTKKAQK